MRRGRSIALLAPLALAGLAASVLVPGGRAEFKASHGSSRVTVAATDFKCTLSRRSAPTGTVIFAVTNKGKASHAFRIAGKKTSSISPGHTATLRVAFTREGRYPYLCTGSGVRGIFSVVAPVTTPATTATTTPPPTVGTASTTVTVELFDDPGPPRFVLSQSTMPSGMVTFVINNKCVSFCSFNLERVKAGTLLGPGESETWTVGLPAGNYLFHCDADPVNMRGSLTVTP
ncbi:MAG: cupredoxin domain-containing protein [Actinomycetota bacterium]|nr:cupredoxin domain-containing protein [Actinomycetota bacterium]